MDSGAIDFPTVKPIGRLTNTDILFGAPISPLDRLKIISSSDFEAVVSEWGNGYLIPCGRYIVCKKCSGSGDKGRDVIAIVDEKNDIWDNYQCKHYKNPLGPSEIWLEIGKLIYYTFIKDYSVPRLYYFVAPLGVGPTLNDLLDKPRDLRNGLLDNWDLKCKDKITSTSKIFLDADLRNYIEKFDFGIFKAYDPLQLIEEHKNTSYFAGRFGGGLARRRPDADKPPNDINVKEMVYTHQLLEVYSDHKKQKINDVNSLNSFEDLKEHFVRQRESFYTADALKQFSRDNLPIDVDYFEELKEDVHTGVVDVYNKSYPDGYQRLIETVIQAKKLQISGNPLENYIQQKDREGICHHLANDKKLIWVRQ